VVQFLALPEGLPHLVRLFQQLVAAAHLHKEMLDTQMVLLGQGLAATFEILATLEMGITLPHLA
jgi:hypothetical protein